MFCSPTPAEKIHKKMEKSKDTFNIFYFLNQNQMQKFITMIVIMIIIIVAIIITSIIIIMTMINLMMKVRMEK